MNTCKYCKEEKSLDCFSRATRTPSGYATYCKDCKNERSRRHYNATREMRLEQMRQDRIKDPQKYRERYKKYYGKYRQEIRERVKKQRAEDNTMYRNQWLRQKYGITVDDYNAMYEKQLGMCQICGVHSSELSKPLHVDHCHETGLVRALLCTRCNAGIGQFLENTETMLSAIEYLKIFKEAQ